MKEPIVTDTTTDEDLRKAYAWMLEEIFNLKVEIYDLHTKLEIFGGDPLLCYILYFGERKGEQIGNVPVGYLKWLSEQESFNKDVTEILTKYARHLDQEDPSKAYWSIRQLVNHEILNQKNLEK